MSQIKEGEIGAEVTGSNVEVYLRYSSETLTIGEARVLAEAITRATLDAEQSAYTLRRAAERAAKNI